MAFVPLKMRDTWKRTLFSPFLSADTLSIQNVQMLGMGLFLGSPGVPPLWAEGGFRFPCVKLLLPSPCCASVNWICDMIQSKNYHPCSPKGRNKWVTGGERGKAEVSATEGGGREHHAKGESWLGNTELCGWGNSRAISAALLRIVLFCFSPTAFEGLDLILTQEKSCRIVIFGKDRECRRNVNTFVLEWWSISFQFIVRGYLMSGILSLVRVCLFFQKNTNKPTFSPPNK